MPRLFALIGFFWLGGLECLIFSMAFTGPIWSRIMAVSMGAAVGLGMLGFLYLAIKEKDWL